MRKRPLGWSCLGVMAVLFFLVRIRPAPFEDYGAYQGKTVAVTGRVYAKETAQREQGPVQVVYLKLSGYDAQDRSERVAGEGVDGARTSPRDESGICCGPPGEKALCYLAAGQKEPELGSVVRIKGKLSVFEKATNQGQFDARSYYQILGISYRLSQAEISSKTGKYHIVSENLYQLRRFLSEKLSQALPQREASVMQTMLLGEKSGMDQELKALYQRNGIAHILAISGLHISMLGMGLCRLLRKCGVPMKISAAASFVLILLYGVMTGFSVSALRAILMFCLRMGSILAERTYDMLTAASVAAAGILLGQPLYFYHSGFLFSFGCVAGIGLLVPLLTVQEDSEGGVLFRFPVGRGGASRLPEKVEKVTGQAVKSLSGALAMAAVTLPVYLWFYYQFPPYSVFLNLLVIPLMSFLMGAGLILLVCEIFCPFPGTPFALMIRGILGIYDRACECCQRLPGNLLTLGQPEPWQVAVYLLLLLTVVLAGKRIKRPLRRGIVLMALMVLIVRPGRGLTLVFLDVGQGDCIYLENAGGGRYLVDGGSSSVSKAGQYRIIPFLKSRGAFRLTAVFVTHPDEDHCNGIRELLEQGEEQGIRVENLVLPQVAGDARTEGYLTLEEQAHAAGIPVSYISRGQKIQSGGLTLDCLHPGRDESGREPNEYSIVLRADYGDFSALLTGDIEGGGERELLRTLEGEESGGRVTVLKAAHHGSRGSTPAEFLESVRPVYTVISCGERNSYGHPHEELLKRLSQCGTRTLITYETGEVDFWTDGRRVRVRRFEDMYQ